MFDIENDPFNIALRDFRHRCKLYVEAYGIVQYAARIDADVFRSELGLLVVTWNPKWHEMATFFDGRESHREHNGFIEYASETLVWEGLRLLRQHAILDELANI